MSAIFGIVGKQGQVLLPAWVSCMQSHLAHRGPDGSATWQGPSVVLGQLMLYTTPESHYEQLPLLYHHWVVVADARLDNRKELFSLLNIPPSLQSTITDSQLIARAFEKWGKNCPEFLIGDFAFAIWDTIQQSLYCARDSAGVRQFFYYNTPEFLIFSSEIRAIATLDFVPLRVDPDSFVYHMIDLAMVGTMAAKTFVRDVNRLMPANWLSLEQQRLSTHLYWKRNPSYKIKFSDANEYGLALRSLIQQAIDDRLRTRFSVGITLSGGLDSSSIACIAARSLSQQGRKLYSASSVLPVHHKGIEQGERDYLDLVLRQEKNIVPQYVTAEGAGVFDGMEDVFSKNYEPVNPFHYMDRALSQALAPHCRVVLSGYVGDGTVSNFGSLVVSELVKQLRFRTALDVLRTRKNVTPKSYYQLLMRNVFMPLLPYDVLQFIKKVRGTSTKKPFDILDTAAGTGLISEQEARHMHETYVRTLARTADHYREIWDTDALWFPGELDLPSHQQQEYAYPFADRRIIEFLWASPPEYFSYKGWPRGYIRRAMEGVLPEPILWRKSKTPFTPNFHARIIEEAPELSKLLASERQSDVSQYFNISHILNKLSNLRPASDWNGFDLQAIIVVYRGVEMIHYLRWLEKS